MAVAAGDLEAFAERMRAAGVQSVDIDEAGNLRRVELSPVARPAPTATTSTSTEPPLTPEERARAEQKAYDEMLFASAGGL